MHAVGREAQDHVAVGDGVQRQEPAALGGANREAREIVITRGEMARHLGGLAPNERTARHGATFADASDHALGDSWIELARGDVIEKEEGLGPVGDEIVDAHGHQIDPHRFVTTRRDGHHELRAHPVGARDENGIAKARGLEVEQRAETAYFRYDAGPFRLLRDRFDGLDQCSGGVYIHAGVLVGE